MKAYLHPAMLVAEHLTRRRAPFAPLLVVPEKPPEFQHLFQPRKMKCWVLGHFYIFV